ncbi:MAG: glycosyltransferase family 4 protein [Chloroflexi bacterium]|nr:glycosyltransferase family 4 protein [Chloroflexota bacterium]
MKVLYLASVVDIPCTDSGTLGGTRHVVEVAGNLVRLGLDVTVFCRGKGRGAEWIEHENLKVRRLYRGSSTTVATEHAGMTAFSRRAIRTPFLWGTRLLQSLDDAVKIVRWARINKVDVIYERINRFSVAGTMASKISGIPLVAEVNDLNFHDISLKRASAIVVPEPRSLKQKFRHKAHQLPWGVDTERIRPLTPCREIKDRLGLNDSPTVMFVGSFLPWHGAVSLVKAAPAVCAAHPYVRFLMVGAGPDETRTRAEIRSLGLEDFFIFAGYVPHDEINRYLSVGDVMVAPYTSELGAQQGRAEMGRSFKVLEYMAAAKPVVVTAVANRSGLIEHGRTGLVVAEDGPEALAVAINCLLKDPARAKAMGERGRKVVEANHTWQRHAQAIKEIFQKVIAA